MGAVALAAAAAWPLATRAADHIDSPSTIAEPAADITDVYAWTTPDAERVNLIGRAPGVRWSPR